MTDAEQPQDIDLRLENLGDEIDLLRTQMRQVREETRFTSQTVSQLQSTVAELAEIARLHQQALRINEHNAEQDRLFMREMQTEVRELQTEIRGIQTENQRILQYLFGQQTE
jgi:chromosome segregation ATPase